MWPVHNHNAASYLLETKPWGENGYTGNENGQCDTLISSYSSGISWSTNWTWAGGQGQVKSYTNVALQMSPAQISTISSIPTSWSWSYTGNNLVADVAYDLFTSSSSSSSSSPSGKAEFEIMVWLGALGGAGPISSTGLPVATLQSSGTTFNLFIGPNGSFTVYSFVAQTPNENYKGDLMEFIQSLESSQGFKSSQYLNSVQAGTEPFTGSGAVLTTKSYYVAAKK